MADRVAIPKKLRFEVFKRDKFTCQYCGGKAPDVLLHADHIKPVVDGGSTDLLNLVTSCAPCNLGKGARPLSDNALMDAQRAQMEALQERREQLEMLIQWRDGLADIGNAQIDALENAICEEFHWSGLSDYGRGQLKLWLKKFPLPELFDALAASVGSYIKFDEKGVVADSAHKAFAMIPRIANVTRAKVKKPWIQDMLYIKGIMRNRFHYVNERVASEQLTLAFELGGDADDLKEMAKQNRNWTGWTNEMAEYIAFLQRGPDGQD